MTQRNITSAERKILLDAFYDRQDTEIVLQKALRALRSYMYLLDNEKLAEIEEVSQFIEEIARFELRTQSELEKLDANKLCIIHRNACLLSMKIAFYAFTCKLSDNDVTQALASADKELSRYVALCKLSAENAISRESATLTEAQIEASEEIAEIVENMIAVLDSRNFHFVDENENEELASEFIARNNLNFEDESTVTSFELFLEVTESFHSDLIEDVARVRELLNIALAR